MDKGTENLIKATESLIERLKLATRFIEDTHPGEDDAQLVTCDNRLDIRDAQQAIANIKGAK